MEKQKLICSLLRNEKVEIKIAISLYLIFKIYMQGRATILIIALMVTLASSYMSFDQFIVKFNKPYSNNQSEEYKQKKQIFDYNIDALNKKNCSECGVTKFFDIAPENFTKKQLTLLEPSQKVSSPVPDQVKNLNKIGAPRYIDWREKGVITSIKDQGECGCCWSFASCALSESSLIMKGLASRSVDLSEQYLLKCTPEGDCQGGYLEYALKVVAQKGIPQQSAYPYNPYKTQSGICSSTSNVRITSKAPQSYYDLTDENVKNLLTVSPLAIAIDATNWEYYTGGIWKCSPYDDVNHAVLLVGYTADGSAWIVKNQWGADWGEGGYIRVSTEQGKNCKIGTAVHMLYGISLQVAAFAFIFLIALIM